MEMEVGDIVDFEQQMVVEVYVLVQQVGVVGDGVIGVVELVCFVEFVVVGQVVFGYYIQDVVGMYDYCVVVELVIDFQWQVDDECWGDVQGSLYY